jgi:hypothetical protein
MKTAKDLIRELIIRGYTRTEIADESRVSVSTISRVYTGEYRDIDYYNGKLLEQFAARKRRKKIIKGGDTE